METEAEAAEYHSKDFEWEELRKEVESDPSLAYHLSPFEPSSSPFPPSFSPSSSSSSSPDSRAWSNFHTRHSTGKFFKERRYLLKEFPELVSCPDYSKVLEVGCGNGSTVLPILRRKENITVYACDCSSEALERAEENLEDASIVGISDCFRPFCCDFAITGFPKWLACDSCQEKFSKMLLPYHSGLSNCCIGGMDFITLIFTLSAVPLQRMPRALSECFSVLKRGGLLFFRDYGLYDMTMLRYEQEKRVGFREYMRSDGTRSYFFSLDSVKDLFLSAGFIKVPIYHFWNLWIWIVLGPGRKEGTTFTVNS
ncbi:hypothetical protein Ancab_000960 [Ancistrocladus abbreviatus]